MSLFHTAWWFPIALVAAIGGAGCSADTAPDEPTGSLHLRLELAPGIQIDEVRWEISGGEMEPMHGVIDTSAPGSTASVEVLGLPSSTSHLVELEAVTTDGEIACRGDAVFVVEAGVSTDVMVMLNCKPPERLGGVRVNGEPNFCAELVKVVVSPLQTSIGDQIHLSALALDAEDDPISYLWLGGGGFVEDIFAPTTTFTCRRVGRSSVTVYVSDGSYPCQDSWTVEVECVHPDSSYEMCIPAERRCNDGPIDPVLPCCDAAVPVQEAACRGDESLSNPLSCTPTGNTVTHQLNAIELAPSCNIGFDLDECDGQSCRNGGLTPDEGLGGVDSALSGTAPLLQGVGVNLSLFNEAFSDSLCGVTRSPQGRRCATPIDPTDVRFVIDANLEEGCANVGIVSSGEEVQSVILNLGQPTTTGTFCASGKLGSIPLDILGMPAELGNAVVRMTVSEDGFADGLMGATLDGDTAVIVGESLIPGLGAVMSQIFDINGDLSADTTQSCTALSATFSIGGGPDEGDMPGDPVVPYDRTDRRSIAPFPDDYYLLEDPTTPSGYRAVLPVPQREMDVQVLYGALSAEAWMQDGFSPIGGIAIPLEAEPDRTSLPVTPEASLDASASMALIDVTPGSDKMGERVPFKLSPVSRRLLGQPVNHSLVLYPSIPLTPKGRYAVVLTRGASTVEGNPFEPSPFMTSVLGTAQPGEAPEVTKARALLQDGVLDVLGDERFVSPPIEKNDIVVVFRFSVRSMDDIHRTPLSMKEQILARPRPGFTINSVDPGFGDVAAVVRGTWESPNWREQQFYVARDGNGDPRITGTLQVPFVLALPRAAETGPVPVVMFQHGSPGTSEDVVWEAELAGLAAEGFAVIGMTDALNREVGPNTDEQSTLLFQTLIVNSRFPHFKLQTYGDQMAFLRFIEGLDSLDHVPFPQGDGVPDLDLAAPLTYVGISMGSMHATAFLSYAPEIKAAALAVGSQRQGEQYFRDGDFLDIFPASLGALIPNATPADYWIGLSIFQMIFDHQDPHNHAQYLYRNRLEVAGTTRKASVLVVEGLGDTQVPNNATRSLAWTVGPIPHLAPIWEASPILEQVTGPVTANIDSETTAAFYQFVPVGTPGIPHTPGCQFEPEGHFCGQSASEAQLQRLLFLKSAVENTAPTITDPLSAAP